jgi:hypothetical protein
MLDQTRLLCGNSLQIWSGKPFGGGQSCYSGWKSSWPPAATWQPGTRIGSKLDQDWINRGAIPRFDFSLRLRNKCFVGQGVGRRIRAPNLINSSGNNAAAR